MFRSDPSPARRRYRRHGSGRLDPDDEDAGVAGRQFVFDGALIEQSGTAFGSLAIDGRADVYALGCILFEMVTGRLCFEAPTIMALRGRHADGPRRVAAPSP